MHKTLTALTLAAFALPQLVAAHEHYEYMIGADTYEITIGSLNEPLVVDDKSGVDFRIAKLEKAASGENGGRHAHGSTGSTPVVGLEETLKVDVIAGDRRKTFELTPVYATPGSYKAQFYPTEATQLSYRIYGTIAGVPFDQTYSCNMAGHNEAPEDTTMVQISDGVMRHLKTGAFSCPVEKTSLGFPTEGVSLAVLSESVDGSNRMAWIATILAGFALAASMRRR